MIIQINFILFISDVSATYTAAIIKDRLKITNLKLNFILRQNDARVFVSLFARACFQSMRACGPLNL